MKKEGKLIRIRDYDPVAIMIRDHERALKAEYRKARLAVGLWLATILVLSTALWFLVVS